MNYVDLFRETLIGLGYDPIIIPNAFDLGYCPTNGWPLKTPTVDFRENTLLVLHFQDFATITSDHSIIELEFLEQFYGKFSNQILVTFWNHNMDLYYSGPIKLVEFSNHNYDFVLALKNKQQHWNNQTLNRNKKWQCLNGRTCQHRREVVKIIQNWEHGIYSYGNVIKLPQWDYTHYRGCENDDNFINLQYIYQQCDVNIVTETIYNTYPGIITEKTLMAFAAQQIPLIIGHRGIVQDCQELGFDMFDDLLDLSYDLLDNNTRLSYALTANQQKIINGLNLCQLQNRLRFNQEYLLNKFPKWMEQRFKQDCARVLDRL
jgi:hypothetical protein